MAQITVAGAAAMVTWSVGYNCDKMVWSDSFEGYFNHFLSSTSSIVSNGGGHTVVPLGEEINLSIIVSPKYIEYSDMERYLRDEVGADLNDVDAFDEECSSNWEVNCFLSYMAHKSEYDNDDYPIIECQALYSGNGLDSSS
ncbi:hypothetical protein [Microbulbifer sp. DLAB2-AA]|uniref:hypothetical protein n=1 Tax=Microbulbifer sp. DLAB2-AA TaxID=3243394 RepID=UPI0040392D7A